VRACTRCRAAHTRANARARQSQKGFTNPDGSSVVLEELSKEGILTVTLNRPKAANAMNDWMCARVAAYVRARD